jgi:acetylornithine deacetylase/succinyl-diaminopimelate desuccinylase-like protein
MEPDPTRLRCTVERLAAIERPSASPGERRAAEWIRGELAALGVPARLQEERAHGTYWVPIGTMSAAAGIAGLAGLPRAVAAAVGALAALGIADDVSGGPHVARRLLPRRTTVNVVAELGERDAPQTLLIGAHHDAARGGLIFHPGPTRAVARRFPRWYARQHTSPQLMRVVVGAPALVALGAALGVPRLRRAAAAVALVTAASLADVALRRVVPGANDNLSSVAVLLELARLLADQPPRGLRVILLSTGSEESFMEGMRGFLARHHAELDPASTRVVCLEALGSPELIALEGEGMLRMHDYDPALKDLLTTAAERAGRTLRRGLRSGFATDALITLRAGYPTATLASCDEYKMAVNYHLRRDTPEHLDYGTIAAATAVCLEAIRALSSPPRPAAPGRA